MRRSMGVDDADRDFSPLSSARAKSFKEILLASLVRNNNYFYYKMIIY